MKPTVQHPVIRQALGKGLNPGTPRNVSKLPVEPAISGLWDR